MMYQLRVDAVKFYYEKQGEHLDDTLACSKELEYDQYMEGRIPWFKEHAWPTLCTYWCSKGFLTKRKRGQESRLKSQDVAQNRGGSRPFVETRQYLAEKYGPEKATTLNTYAAMKYGLKNWDGGGSINSTISQKARKRLDNYSALARAAHPDDWEQQELDRRMLYESSGGIPHGRLQTADGAIQKVDVISAARERNLKPTTSLADRQMVRENEELKRQNANLKQRVDMNQQLILALYRELGKELPADVLRQLTSSQPDGTTNSCHTGSQGVDGNTGGGGLGANNGCDDSAENTGN
ncbi:hypothetical protein ACQ4PT_058689 [Festuca glaucescens]